MASKLNPWKIQGYKPGQNVICRIVKSEPGGYAVVIPKDNLPGFLPSEQTHVPGKEVLAQFVCVDKNRMLLSERFTAGSSGAKPKTQTVNWLEQLEDPDGVYSTGKHQSLSSQMAADPNTALSPTGNYTEEAQQAQAQYQQEQYQPEPGSGQGSEIEQNPYQQDQYQTGQQPSPEEQAFKVYANSVPPKTYQLRRAIDLIMPPVDQDSLKSLRIGDYDIEWLITDLEGGMRTGCVKATCESRLSRAAMLLYRGRAVGCIYGCRADPDTKPTEESLNLMLNDLESPDTLVTLYDLPEDITLAMSALFLGYPVKREDNYSALDYMRYICDWFEKEKGTATLAISMSGGRGMCLGYIFKGEFRGSFYVEDQAFHPDRSYIEQILQNDPEATLGVSILPPQMTSSAVRFGFSLSMARKNNNQEF